MLCILCLKAKDEIINIFDAHGLNLNVSNIVTTHFWLQPNEDNPDAKVICSICWNALESFHKFYKEVEQAHVALFAVLPAENLLRSASSPSPNIVKTYPDLFTASTKVEIGEDCKVALTEYDVEKFDNPLKVQDIKSESESEIPLSNLIKSRKSPSVEENNINRDRTLKKKKPKKEIATDDEETDEESFKQWPASTYAEETDHKIGYKHLDAVIESTLKLSCNICNVALSGYTALRDHYRAAHNEFGYIACCDKKFDKRVALVDHLLFHKNPEYFKCEICDRNFANRKNLKAHLKGHDKKFIFHCDSCPKSFHQKLLLDRHRDIHILDRTFKCDECGKLYASKFTLGQHVYGVHKGGYTKVCDQCGKVFRDLETFRRHNVVHTDEPKPFVSCDKCGIKLANRSVLLKHMKYKHAETNVTQVCNICGNISSNIFALKRHITYMHKYERKFKCPMCDKGFKTAIILKEHMSTHTGEVLYTCPHCPKTFNSNANMHSHRKKMHRKEWEENRRHPHMGAVANAE